MANKTRYIDTDMSNSNGNGLTRETAYDSLVLWQANEAGPVAGGEYHEVYCYGSKSDVATNITGWSATSANGVRILGDARSGVWDESKYHIKTSTSASGETALIVPHSDNVALDHLQLFNTNTANETYGNAISDRSGGTLQISNCILKITNENSSVNGPTHCCHFQFTKANATKIFFNNIVMYGIRGAYFSNMPSGITLHAINNSFIGDVRTNGQGLQVTNASSYTGINNLSYGWQGVDYNISGSPGYEAANSASDTSAPATAWNPDGTNFNNRTPTFNNAGADDFTLSEFDTGATGIGMGFGERAEIPEFDIQDDKRGISPSRTSCGFDEYVPLSLFNPAFARKVNNLL